MEILSMRMPGHVQTVVVASLVCYRYRLQLVHVQIWAAYTVLETINTFLFTF